MSAETDWVLAQLASVVSAQPDDHPLKRVDRENSDVLEDNIRDLEDELMEANFIGAKLTDRNPSPVGLEFDNAIEAIVGVRIVGLHHSKFGHVDPDGVDGVEFDADSGLVRDIRRAVLAGREFPDAGGPDVDYHTLFIENESPLSGQYQDLYHYEFDARFVGYEELP